MLVESSVANTPQSCLRPARTGYVILLWVDRRKHLLASQTQTAFSACDPRRPHGPAAATRLVSRRAITDALDAEYPRDTLGEFDGQLAQLATTTGRWVLGQMPRPLRHRRFDTALVSASALPARCRQEGRGCLTLEQVEDRGSSE